MWIIGKTRQGIITWLQDERNSTELSSTQLINYTLSRTQQNSAARRTELSGTWQDLTTWLAEPANKLAETWVHDWHNTKEINGKQLDYWAKLGSAWLHGCNMNRTQQNLAALNYMSSRTQQNSAVRWTELSGTWHGLTTWLAELRTNLQKTLKKQQKTCELLGKLGKAYMVAIWAELSRT